MAHSAIMNVMVDAATKAGRGLKRDFGEIENLQVSRKGPGDFVSMADLRSEKILREELKQARPGYSFLMEESGEEIGKDPQHRWIIDPLDGTTNFLHGIPQFAISIALERQGELVAALIYNPATEELFTSEKGKGAFLNDRRLRVAGRRDLSQCVIGCGVPHLGLGNHGLFLKQLRYIMGECSGIRREGAAALDLASVAAGRLDGFWENGLHYWDIAAGILMIREAGGFIANMKNEQKFEENAGIVTGNEAIFRKLKTQLKKAAQA